MSYPIPLRKRLVLTLFISLALLIPTLCHSQTIGMAPGFAIWASNRDGDWEIFRINTDGTGIQQLTNDDVADMNARISPDGHKIAWTRGAERRTDVWIMQTDGTGPRKLVSNAAMGEWRPDGQIVFFRGRNEEETYLYDPSANTEKKLWPPIPRTDPKEIRGATPSPDASLYVGWSPNPRGTWILKADGTPVKHVHGGCEGRFAPDGSFVYWVMTAGTFGRATLDGQVQEPLYQIHEAEYGHTYFPRLSADMKWLIFGACPNNQHHHDTSDYEIFLMKMDNLRPAWAEPVRLTFNPGTDRWPDIFLYQDDTPPPAPRELQADAEGQQIQLTWQPVDDPETGIQYYQIYRDDSPLTQVWDASTYTDLETGAHRKYRYAVTAVNMAGLESPLSRSRTAKTRDSRPTPPQDLSARSGEGLIRLTWAQNPEQDVQEYRIYRADAEDGPYKRLPAVSQPSYQDTRVSNGQTYYYRVTAIDAKGQESERSVVTAGTPQKRVTEGLIALYRFLEGQGEAVHDVSGVKPELDLQIQNPDKVHWLDATPGIEFIGSTMLRSEGNADKLLDSLRTTGRITIEVWMEPANFSQSGPARIVSMSQNPVLRDFTLGQIEGDLAYRLRTTRTSENGSPELDTTHHVLTPGSNHVVATFNGRKTVLFINGHQHSETLELGGDFSNWQPYPLLLGNEATGDRTWLGKINLVAIYNRVLSNEEVQRNYQAGLAELGDSEPTPHQQAGR